MEEQFSPVYRKISKMKKLRKFQNPLKNTPHDMGTPTSPNEMGIQDL